MFTLVAVITGTLIPSTSTKLTNSMGQNHFREPNSHSANQEIACHLWNLGVFYCVDKDPSSSSPSVTFHNKLVIYSRLLAAYLVYLQHCEVIF